jgi:hypothetical protein
MDKKLNLTRQRLGTFELLDLHLFKKYVIGRLADITSGVLPMCR